MPHRVILGFDTCSPLLSIALKYRNQLFTHEIDCAGNTPTSQQSSHLLPALTDFLHQRGLTFQDVTDLCVTKGPGSFTGIRLGLAAAQGLKFSINARCYSATTLQALALLGFRRTGRPTQRALIDNQRGQYYGQHFNHDLSPLSEATLYPQADTPETILYQGEPLAPLLITLIEDYATFLDPNLQPFYLVNPTYATQPPFAAGS